LAKQQAGGLLTPQPVVLATAVANGHSRKTLRRVSFIDLRDLTQGPHAEASQQQRGMWACDGFPDVEGQLVQRSASDGAENVQCKLRTHTHTCLHNT
jgi:hypothetical protein